MKKLLSILVAMVLVVSLAACGGGNEAPPVENTNENTNTESAAADTAVETDDASAEDVVEESESDSTDKELVNLVIWEAPDATQTFVEYAIGEFMKQYPHISVEFQPVSAIDAASKMVLDGPNGKGADVFGAPNNDLGKLMEAGLVLENDMTNPDEFMAGVIAGATYDGVLYGYPQTTETYALFWNKDIVDEAPATYDEVIEFAESFNDPSSNRYAYMFDVANVYFNHMYMAGYGAHIFGEDGTDAATLGYDSPAAIEAITFYQSLRDIYDVAAADATGDQMTAAFKSGNCAFMVTGPWATQDLLDSGVNFGVAELPLLPNGEHPISFSGSRYNFVSSFTDHPEEAKLLADFLTSKEMLEKRFELAQQIPTRLDITVEDPYAMGILQQAKYSVPMPSIPEMGSVWGPMGSAYANIWNGGDVEEELMAAAAAIKESIGQ